MRKQTLLGLLGLLGICYSAMAAAVAVDDGPADVEKSSVSRVAVDGVGPAGEAALADDEPQIVSDMTPVLLDPHMAFEHVVMDRDGKVTAGSGDEGGVAGIGETLIYENVLGIHSVNFPTNQVVADDISTIAPDGCSLTRYKFKVLGKVLPTGAGGAYTATYALYSNCPNAVGTTNALRDLVKIPGTDGVIAFPDDLPRTIEHTVPFLTPVALPNNVYLGVRFNRGNCGTVVGAPASIGYSGDIWDSPSFPCYAFLGGFPALAHSSFWVEMYGTTNCDPAFVGYKCQKPSSPPVAIGANVQGVDDIKLIVNNCSMIGYEVAVKGTGFYSFDLRRNCDGSVIAGTERTFQIGPSTVPSLQVARFTFNPPIRLTTDALYFGFKCSSNSAGAILAGVDPIVGSSTPDYFSIGLEGCSPILPTDGVHGAINLAITCAGSQPLGACCDPYLTECNAGADLGKRCISSADCALPGTCEAVCRETSEINCPFPPRGLEQLPPWRLGEACSPDPFVPNTCGVAACCHMKPCPENPQVLCEVCENLTKNECDSAPPLDRPRLWQIGQYCGQNAQRCPRNACLGVDGSCYIAHATPGCSEPFCCTDVCLSGVAGAFCCNVAWDNACVALAQDLCDVPPPNDQCAPNFPLPRTEGALSIPVPGSATTDNTKATDALPDPGFCCNSGVGLCIGGLNPGATCIVDADCPDAPQNPGSCSEVTPDPGATALHSIWFKFTMPLGVCAGGATPNAPCSTAAQCTGLVCVGGANAGQPCTVAGNCPGGTCPANGTCNGGTDAGVSTCNSNSPALDSVLQVFKAGDHSTALTECSSLSVIGCNDDASNCGSTQRNSRLCLRNLTRGETYYVLLSSKTENRFGQYRVTLSTSCSGGTNDSVANDYCQRATPITDATPANPLVIPFTLGRGCNGGANAGKPCTVSADCPGGSCSIGPATFDCPAAACLPNSQNDIWFDYTATCTGEAIISTCGGTNPNTNLIVYDDCTKCPPFSGTPMDNGCSGDFLQLGCGEASRVVVDVTEGNCYKIRLADQEGFAVSGNLTITCNSGDCDNNGISDDVDMANCPPGTGPASCQDCNGNGRLDFCDIRDLIEPDCQPNGIPDSCELTGNDCQPNGIPDDCDGGVGCGCSGFVSSVPTDCTVDARRPHAPGIPVPPEGRNSLTMTFSSDPCTAAPGDFTVTCSPTAAPCPTVSTVTAVAATQTITLSSVIPAGNWTCVRHTATGAKVCLGSLPGDANGSLGTAPDDILKLVDNLNGVVVLTTDHCDMNRSGACTAEDIISLIDMLNGANAYIVWNAKTLPACPAP